MQITSGIHLVDGVRGANAYLLEEGGGLVAIDAGLSGNSGRIVDYAKANGFAADRITTIIVSHPDIDHAGGVARLKELTNAKVAIHEDDAARLSGEKGPKAAKGGLGMIMKVVGRMMKLTPVKPDIVLKDGDEIAGLRVIHTPGHTEGSICLLSPAGVLFAGDTLRVSKDGRPKLPGDALNIDTEQVKASVRKLSEMEFSILLPGHGPPITANASGLVKELVASDFK